MARPGSQSVTVGLLKGHSFRLSLYSASSTTIPTVHTHNRHRTTLIMSPTFTEDHPYVQAYLKRVAAAMLQAEDCAHELGSVSGCADPRWHQCTGHDQCSNWWRADYGGVAYPAGVADVLSPTDAAKFSVYDLQRIFVVAALAVYARPKHPAHWAFWAKNARYRVAKEVQEVIRECRCLQGWHDGGLTGC